MNLIRKLKLRKLTGVDYLSDKESEIINFVKDKLSNLSEFTIPQYPTIIFYMNREGKWILQYNKYGNLYIPYHDFWEVLTNLYEIEHDDIEYIIQYMVRTIYKLDIAYVYYKKIDIERIVETAYKSRQ